MDSKTNGNIRDSVFVKTYLVGLALGLILWPVAGAALAAEIAIAAFWGLQLLMLILKHVSDQAWVRLVVEFFPPLVLWILFGFGGILAILRVDGWDMYSDYDDLTVVLTTIFMLLGSYAYLLGVRIALGRDKLVWDKSKQNIAGKARILLLVILVIDWSVRFQKNLAGVYVNWIAKSGYFSAAERGTTNALYQLQANIGMITIPLLVYLSMEDRLKWLFRLLLVIQLTLIFLEGDRSELLMALVIATSSYGVTRGVRVRISVVAWGILATFIFFSVIGPIIQEARIQMRRDVRVLAQEKSLMTITFAAVYLPDAVGTNIFNDNIIQDSLVKRMGAYSFYAAAIHQSMLDGKADLLVDDFLPTVMQLVPRVLYANKGTRSSNYILQSHFKIGSVGADAHGTPVVDIFGYGYVLGIVGLMFVSGLGFGLIVKYLTKEHGLLGGLVAIGLIPVLSPMGDSFIGYLAGLRNTLILLLIIALVDLVCTIGSSEEDASSQSSEVLNAP